MKPVVISFLLCAFVVLCYGVSQPIIPNTKAEGCIEGTCGSHCAWDGAKLFPYDNLNQPGKCRVLKCSKNFEIVITPCPFDSKTINRDLNIEKIIHFPFSVTGQYEWVKPDKTKLYPECCGSKTKKQ